MNNASIAALQQLQTLITAPNLSSAAATTAWLASIATQLQTIGADTTAPAAVNSAVNVANTAAGKVAQDIVAGTSPVADLTALGQAISKLATATSGAVVLGDVATNTCTGYSNKDVTSYQSAAGLPITGIYDAATVTSLTALFGASAVPPVCASGSGSAGGATSTTTGTITPVAAQPATSATTTALIVGASVIAIGGLAFLLYQSGKAATALKTNPRKRRG